MKRWKTFVPVALLAVALVVGVYVLRSRSSSPQETDLTQVVQVTRGNMTASVSPTGQVAAQQQVQLSFDVSRLPVTEVLVAAGQEVEKGDVLVKIDASSLERAVEQAEANLLSAEEALEKARNPYTALERQKAELDVAQAEVALAQARQESVEEILQDAEQAWQDARDQLTVLENDTSTQEQFERLQWQANVAEAEHGKLLEGPIITEEGRDRQVLAYNKMMDGRDSLELAKARAALNLLNARAKVHETEETLADLRAGSNSLAVAQVANKVAQAEYNFARAQDNLATIAAGADAKSVQLARSERDAARATLEDARGRLESATMVAPFSGTVTAVGVKAGDLVSSGTNVVTLADLTKLEVVATVDETEISQVKVGQTASITFDAVSGARFTGRVVQVPLVGQLVQNVVSYDVVLSMEGTGGGALLPGMTANVTIIVGQKQNVLLLPVLAIAQEDTGDVVTLEDTGETTPVEVGLSNGTYVEIVRGLNEGDRVVVAYSASSTEQQFFMRGSGNISSFGAGGLGR